VIKWTFVEWHQFFKKFAEFSVIMKVPLMLCTAVFEGWDVPPVVWFCSGALEKLWVVTPTDITSDSYIRHLELNASERQLLKPLNHSCSCLCYIIVKITAHLFNFFAANFLQKLANFFLVWKLVNVVVMFSESVWSLQVTDRLVIGWLDKIDQT